MDTGLSGKTYIQCMGCGRIHMVRQHVPIEHLYVKMTCPKCGHAVGLNCGSNEDDLYALYDVNMDPRYYKY